MPARYQPLGVPPPAPQAYHLRASLPNRRTLAGTPAGRGALYLSIGIIHRPPQSHETIPLKEKISLVAFSVYTASIITL
jgi:hypothetical protein